MAGWDDVTTYEQLQAMAPSEREAHLRASLVTDLDDLTPRERELLQEQDRRVRARGTLARQGVVTDRRAVRVLPEFFTLLDQQLPRERGPNGEPTAAEFAASDLLDIVDAFAAL
jgi:hypothetical protein